MFDRLDPSAVLRGHWNGLRNRSVTSSKPDLAARLVIVLVPSGAAILVLVRGVHLQQPGVLVSGLSLLSAGLLAAFAQIATIRSRYPVPDDPTFDAEKSTRDMLDEAVAHILTAALISAATAAVIIVGMNLGVPEHSASEAAQSSPAPIGSACSVIATWTGTYLWILFVMTVRKLYGAYVVANDVSPELSGHHS